MEFSTAWPKISIVTPSYNQGTWLEATIVTVLSQNYPNLEYGIVDGMSTDGTPAILERYSDKLSFIIREPDGGMYDAIQKGFARTTGQIMGWLNSDDMLHPGSLHMLARIFTDLPQVRWLTGSQTTFDEAGACVHAQPPPPWAPEHFALGRYEWIQQESTYWRRELFTQIGGTLDTSLRLAGDYALWHRMFQHAPLYVTNGLIGGFRARSAQQASLDSMAAYKAEAATFATAHPFSQNIMDNAAKIRSLEGRGGAVKAALAGQNKSDLLLSLYTIPPRVMLDRATQRFTLQP